MSPVFGNKANVKIQFLIAIESLYFVRSEILIGNSLRFFIVLLKVPIDIKIFLLSKNFYFGNKQVSKFVADTNHVKMPVRLVISKSFRVTES